MDFVVHGGAGSCSAEHAQRIKYAMEKALREKCSLGEYAGFFEESSLFNCGAGSNRTSSGLIENECCIMDSTGSFAAVCMIPEGISPYKTVLRYLQIEREPGLVKPVSIVYSDGLFSADREKKMPQRMDISSVEKTKKCAPSTPISGIEMDVHMASDTIGVIEMGRTYIRAVSSSGGPKKKYSGRIGPCSVYGANTFVSENACVLVSGTGESLIRSQLAQKIHEKVDQMLFEEIKEEIEEFMEKERHFPYIGGVAVYRKSPGEVFIVHFQSAAAFVFGYSINRRVRVIVHRQNPGDIVVNVEKIRLLEKTPNK